MHTNILLRSQIIASIRRRMADLGFFEFQTLCRYTSYGDELACSERGIRC